MVYRTSEVQQAIALLTSLGYTVSKIEEDPIEDQYYMQSEVWENNPLEYVSWLTGRNRREMVDLFNNLDHERMVSTWRLDTIYDVLDAGSDIALNKRGRILMRRACTEEVNNRLGQPQPTDRNRKGGSGRQRLKTGHSYN